MFFDDLEAGSYAITNIDDRNGLIMVQNTRAEVVTCSCRNMADHMCKVIEQGFDGMLLDIDGTETWTRLIGMHNAYNILAVYSTAMVLGADKNETLVALSALEAAPGRLESISGPEDKAVVTDYAHTPDALDNVHKTLRETDPSSNLVCVFGCGGDRDRSKRPEMAAIAQKWADRIIITSHNSRTERTSDIIDEIKRGLDIQGRMKTVSIEDREEAIRAAITMSGPSSTILLAGKGHEDYQIIGTEKRHFDEKEIVSRIFDEIKNCRES